MEKRTVRFNSLASYQQQHETTGIPDAAFETIAARRVYPVMVPEAYSGRSAMAPFKGAPGLAITVAECPPGNGAGLHAHEQSIENFFCLDGRFEIAWGDRGEHSTVLEPLDFISIPAGVCRSFKNLGAETARLLVIIQILGAEQADRVHFAPRLGDAIAHRHGADALAALSRIGFKFDAGAD
jgi:uncharacterized RmlC-like cupin family protein